MFWSQATPRTSGCGRFAACAIIDLLCGRRAEWLDVSAGGDMSQADGRGGGELGLGVTGILLGVVAVVVAFVDSRGRGHSPIPGPVWQVLVLCACLAGLGAIVAWFLSGDRWRPAAVVGAVL